MIGRPKSRPSTSLRLLCDTAEDLGLAVEDCLKNTGIALGDLGDPNALYSPDQEIQLIQNLVALSPSSVGLGVAVGHKMHVNSFGIWGFAVLTSPTLRAAIQTAIEYIRLSFVLADMTLKEEGNSARIEFDVGRLPKNVRRFIVERHAAVTMNFVSALLPEELTEGFTICVQESDETYLKDLSTSIGRPVVGSMPKAAVMFPASLLDQKLPKFEPVTLKFCLDQCKELIEKTGGELPKWSQKVRDLVMDDIAAEQRIETVAQKLSVTERTLRRRLTQEGTSFRALYNDARMAIGYELLETAGLNVESTARRVGYAETASFVRAFSKQFETTPGEVRRKT